MGIDDRLPSQDCRAFRLEISIANRRKGLTITADFIVCLFRFTAIFLFLVALRIVLFTFRLKIVNIYCTNFKRDNK